MKSGIIVMALALLSIVETKAQLKDPTISFSVQPTLGNRLMTFRSNVSSRVKDSINSMDRMRDALGAQIMVSFSTSQSARIHFGLQFQNFGYTRRRENYRFLDTIHPEIGVMNDLSQTGGNYADFNFRYHYIAIPFLFSKEIKSKSVKESKMQFLIGGSIAALVNHDIKAQLRGFSTKDGKDFRLKDEDNQAGRFNANLQISFRLENPLYGKNTFIFVQPDLFVPILKANYSSMRAQLYAFGLQVGVMFKLDKDKA
ncbi:MAG TPA: hypothetical protein VGF79_13135 [Bacteroidia bacterium]